jgi:tetratricopeptide (TPR) repeat protein
VAVRGPLQDAERLLGQGQLDAALAALQGAPPGAESLYLQGLVWARKAQLAPLPTPGGPSQPAPEFKDEEVQAVSLFEQAVAAQGNLGPAHLALAELLAPHAVRRTPVAPPAKTHGKRSKTPEPTAPPSAGAGPDASADRVIREYRLAAQYDPGNKAPVESWIAFCERADRPVDADAAYQELVKREKESAAPLVRYGDFLRVQKKWDGAIAQYSQALIWRADDEETRVKIGEIYLGLGEEYMGRQQYGAAEQRFRDAQKYVKDRNSPTGRRLQALQAQLAQIRR